MIAQRQRTKTLAAERESPIRKSSVMLLLRRCSTERRDDRNLFLDIIRRAKIAVIQQIRDQRVQPVHRDELFGKVERRPKVIHATIDVIRIANVPNVLGVLVEAEE